jgi:Domain of unknown function (DUF4124)
MKYPIGYFSILSKAMIFALLGLVAFQPDPAIAKIYKYKDEHGKTYFTDDASKIPLRYRKKGSVKKFREVNEPTPASGAPKGFPGQASAGGSKGEGKDEGKEDGVLSSREVALVGKTIQVFKVGIALGDQYKDTMPNFFNGQGAVNAIQSVLPLKESLAAELAGAKVPELQEALGFLKQSIAVDQQTTSVGQGLTTRVAGILNRLGDEGKQQAALIKKLEQALKNSEKKKAEAKKKKEEEAKKKAEEAEREAEEAKKKKEEEADKKAEESKN